MAIDVKMMNDLYQQAVEEIEKRTKEAVLKSVEVLCEQWCIDLDDTKDFFGSSLKQAIDSAEVNHGD